MQIWLPEPNFARSLRALDGPLLCRQRDDVLKLLETLTGTSRTMTYKNHPLVDMWRGCEYTLATYGMAACLEWRNRGNPDEMTDQFTAFMHDALRSNALPLDGHNGVPWWLGNGNYHDSHKASLLFRDERYYRPLWPGISLSFWRNMPSIWPAYKPPVPRGPEHDKYLTESERTISAT